MSSDEEPAGPFGIRVPEHGGATRPSTWKDLSILAVTVVLATGAGVAWPDDGDVPRWVIAVAIAATAAWAMAVTSHLTAHRRYRAELGAIGAPLAVATKAAQRLSKDVDDGRIDLAAGDARSRVAEFLGSLAQLIADAQGCERDLRTAGSLRKADDVADSWQRTAIARNDLAARTQVIGPL